MSRPSDDDREAVDRAFAELVAGYHLTADRPDPLLDPSSPSTESSDQPAHDQSGNDHELREQPAHDQPVRDHEARDQPAPVAPITTEAESTDASWADAHPLFRFEEPAVVDDEPEPDDEFVPEPLMPLPRPAWPALAAWIAMGYAVLVVLAISVGIQLPTWVGWMALVGFVGGFGVLMSRLPRHRPPDAGNGAVL